MKREDIDVPDRYRVDVLGAEPHHAEVYRDGYLAGWTDRAEKDHDFVRFDAWAFRALLLGAVAVLVICVVSVSGCVGVIPWSEPSREVCGETDRACMEIVEVEAECRQLDGSYKAWKAVGMALTGVAGATGTGGVLTATLADEPAADVTMAAVSAGSAIFSTVSYWLAGELAEDVAECLQRLERLRSARKEDGHE